MNQLKEAIAKQLAQEVLRFAKRLNANSAEGIRVEAQIISPLLTQIKVRLPRGVREFSVRLTEHV